MIWASLVAQLLKNPPAMQETWVQFLGWEDPMEKGKATHSSILAWRIPWAVGFMGSQRVGHGLVTFTFAFKVRSQNMSLTKIKVPSGLPFLMEAPGESCFLLPFPASWGFFHSLASGPFLHLQV